MRLKHHHQRQNLGPSSSSGGNPTVLALVPAARPEIEMYSGISGLPPLACAARQEGHRRDLRVGSLGLLLASREWSPELATEADGCRQRRGGGSHREPARLGLGCCDLPLSLLERARLRCWVMQSRPRLYFVRHGRSTHNESQEERPLIWDAPLHKIGLRQAAKLRGRLRHVPLELCVSSPLRRALQTALVALGDWAPLAPGCEAAVEEGRATVVSVEVTLLARERRLRFDAHPGDFSEPLEGGLGPGAEVRLARAVRLQGAERPLGAGTACTVTGAAVALGGGLGPRTCLEGACLEAFPCAAPPRCPVLGARTGLEPGQVESDDLGTAAPRLRGLFPSVDFSRLPADGRAWWWSSPAVAGSGDAEACRARWAQAGYEEPRADFRARVGRLVRHLTDLAARHAHVAVFAHCWVLEEIWRQQFGRGRRFGNAELAVVEVAAGGSWAWLRRGHGLPRDSSESSGGQLQQPQQQRQPLEQPRPRPRRRSERRRLGGAARWKRPCSLPPP
ncbi:unnamed protein product, partial [Prorocentrum cordatum]